MSKMKHDEPLADTVPWTAGSWAVAMSGWTTGHANGGSIEAQRPTGKYIKEGDRFAPEPIYSGTHICNYTLSGAGYGEKEGRANARLISAAPDLYAALANALSVIEATAMTDGQGGEDPDQEPLEAARAMARAALVKARGK